jgi:general secretion pathway protein L
MASQRDIIVMENKLLIYILDRALEKIYWFYFNEKGEKSFSQKPVTLSECPKLDIKPEIIVLFPTEEILLTEVDLPPTKRSQQGKVALFALEEKLADEVQNLHAIVVNSAVGVIHKILLEEWLEKLKAENIIPDILLPDVLAIPITENRWTKLLIEERALVRRGLYQGFAISKENLQMMINKLQPVALDDLEMNSEEAILEMFLQEVETRKYLLSPFNLLQGEYKQKTEWLGLASKKVWRIPALLGICWFVLFIGMNLTKYILLSEEDKKVSDEISMLYKTIYPEATSIVSPRERLQKELEQLKETGQNQNSLELIANSGNILKEMPEIEIQNLSFKEGQLSVNIQTKDFQMLEKAVRALEKAKLDVKQSDATRAEEKVIATLAIKSGGASS